MKALAKFRHSHRMILQRPTRDDLEMMILKRPKPPKCATVGRRLVKTNPASKLLRRHQTPTVLIDPLNPLGSPDCQIRLLDSHRYYGDVIPIFSEYLSQRRDSHLPCSTDMMVDHTYALYQV